MLIPYVDGSLILLLDLTLQGLQKARGVYLVALQHGVTLIYHFLKGGKKTHHSSRSSLNTVKNHSTAEK